MLHPFLIDVIPNDQLIPTGEDDMAAKVENELVGLRVVEGRYSSVDDFIPHECVWLYFLILHFAALSIDCKGFHIKAPFGFFD